MEEILEIRKECETPLELLKSEAFSRYVEIYKSEFIKELKKKRGFKSQRRCCTQN